jgi:hypothetical protein
MLKDLLLHLKVKDHMLKDLILMLLEKLLTLKATLPPPQVITLMLKVVKL